jgi:hypothetical protein
VIDRQAVQAAQPKAKRLAIIETVAPGRMVRQK